MYFGYNDDERILRNSVHEMFRKHVPISEVRKVIERPAVNKSLLKLIGEQGLLGVLSRNGDAYEGLLMATSILEEAGRVLLPFPLIEGMIGAYFLSRDKAKASQHEKVVSGAELLTFAWHTVGRPRLERRNEQLVANGSFFGAPYAASADKILAFFDGPASGQATLLILDRRDPAVSVKATKGMDGSMPLDRVDISDLAVAESDVLLGLGKGAELREEAERLGALFTAAELVGVSEESIRVTVEYTKVRKQFGQEIAKFQALKHMAAEMYVLAESSRVAVIYAGWALESGTELEAVSIAKAYAADAAIEITGQAIQMHGGIGYTWESDMHLYFKRARRSASAFGDSYCHREKVLNKLVQRAADSV